MDNHIDQIGIVTFLETFQEELVRKTKTFAKQPLNFFLADSGRYQPF